MRLVIIESPYAGDTDRNVQYARRCLRDSLNRGEAPLASHLLYTQPTVLNDADQTEREWGLVAGSTWYVAADACVVYVDNGVSDGMWYGIGTAESAGVPVEVRSLDGNEPVLPPVPEWVRTP